MTKMMRLMSLKQYSKMTKAKLVRKIMMALKKLPKKKLALMCYELEKRRLPTISTTKKGMPRLTARPAYSKLRMVKGTAKGFAQHRAMNRRPKRSAKQLANDKRLGRMAKARAKAIRQGKRISYNMRA